MAFSENGKGEKASGKMLVSWRIMLTCVMMQENIHEW